MNPTEITATVQRGFHIALGATATLVEDLQNPDKINQTLRRLSDDRDSVVQEWIDKGAMTEQDARKLVDSLLAGQGFGSSTSSSGGPSSSNGYTTITTTALPVESASLDADLKELTAQIAALRQALEQARQNPG